MSMGQRQGQRQEELWVPSAQMPQAPGHPFYQRLNQLLARHGFDAFVEGLCEKFYDASLGRPSVPPSIYFRMLLVGYFEGLDSERAIAWRCAESRTLNSFLGYGPRESTPDHSSLSIIRQRGGSPGAGAGVEGGLQSEAAAQRAGVSDPGAVRGGDGVGCSRARFPRPCAPHAFGRRNSHNAWHIEWGHLTRSFRYSAAFL